MRESHPDKDQQCDDNGGNRGQHHVADMIEKRGVRDGRGQHGRVRQRGDLIAEVGTADDRSSYPPGREALRLSDSHQGDTDCGDGGPRATGHYRYHGADHAAGGQEKVGVDDLHPIID